MPAPEGFKKVKNPVTQEEEIQPRAEGWNLTRDERLRMWELNGKKEIKEMIRQQALLPEAMRDYSGTRFVKRGGTQPPDKPGYNILSLDVFSTGAYASGAHLKNEQNRRLGLKDDAGIKNAIFPSDVLISDTQTAETKRWEQATRFNPLYQVLPKWGKKIYTDIAWDPTSYVTSGIGGATKILSSGGKTIGLTTKGVKEYAKILQKYPAIKSVDEFGRTVQHLNPEVRHLISRALKTNPEMVQKEGYRFILTNIELVPKKYLPWAYLGSLGSKAGNSINQLYVGLKHRIVDVGQKASRFEPPGYINALKNIGKKDYPQDITGWGIKRGVSLSSTIAGRTKNTLAELKAIEDEARNKLGDSAGTLITQYIENEKTRHLMPSVKPFADRIQDIHNAMKVEEQRLGLLTSSKTNYVRHLITNQYRKMRKLGQTSAKAGMYNLHREIDSTIIEASPILFSLNHV